MSSWDLGAKKQIPNTIFRLTVISWFNFCTFLFALFRNWTILSWVLWDVWDLWKLFVSYYFQELDHTFLGIVGCMGLVETICELLFSSRRDMSLSYTCFILSKKDWSRCREKVKRIFVHFLKVFMNLSYLYQNLDISGKL